MSSPVFETLLVSTGRNCSGPPWTKFLVSGNPERTVRHLLYHLKCSPSSISVPGMTIKNAVLKNSALSWSKSTETLL